MYHKTDIRLLCLFQIPGDWWLKLNLWQKSSRIWFKIEEKLKKICFALKKGLKKAKYLLLFASLKFKFSNKMKICIIFVLHQLGLNGSRRCMYLEQTLGINSVIDTKLSKFFKCVLNLVDREKMLSFPYIFFYMMINHFT